MAKVRVLNGSKVILLYPHLLQTTKDFKRPENKSEIILLFLSIISLLELIVLIVLLILVLLLFIVFKLFCGLAGNLCVEALSVLFWYTVRFFWIHDI